MIALKKFCTAERGLLGILICAMLVPFLIICIVSTVFNFISTKKILSQNLETSCSLAANAIESFFNSYADSLALLGATSPVQRLTDPTVQPSDTDQAFIGNMLQSQMSVNLSTQAIFLVNSSGDVLATTDEALSSAVLSRVALPDQSQFTKYAIRFISQDSGQNSILLFCPVYSQETQLFCGYLVGLISLDDIQKLLDATILPDFSAMILLDESGQTVFALFQEKIERFSDNTAFDEALKAVLNDEPSSGTPPASNSGFLSGYPSVVFSVGTGIDREDFIAYHTQVGSGNWNFIIASHVKSLYNTLISIFILTAVVLVLGIVTWVILSVYTSRRIATPMKEMVDQLSIEAQRNYILNALSGILIAEYDCDADILRIPVEYAEANHLPSVVDHWSERVRGTMPADGAPLPQVPFEAINNVGDTGFL
ncbi:MAG: hypothetical protein H6Q60_1477, partial [Oscillospiraceae bacterium]|nr:hypothetical protein [Oscillospiraceae bacterium]